jgi:hypothetical protein
MNGQTPKNKETLLGDTFLGQHVNETNFFILAKVAFSLGHANAVNGKSFKSLGNLCKDNSDNFYRYLVELARVTGFCTAHADALEEKLVEQYQVRRAPGMYGMKSGHHCFLVDLKNGGVVSCSVPPDSNKQTDCDCPVYSLLLVDKKIDDNLYLDEWGYVGGEKTFCTLDKISNELANLDAKWNGGIPSEDVAPREK